MLQDRDFILDHIRRKEIGTELLDSNLGSTKASFHDLRLSERH